MEDKLLPLDRGSARGGGTNNQDDRKERYKRAPKSIQKGLSDDDPLACVPLQFEPIILHRSHSHACECGGTEFTVLAYKCCKCGKKSV